ncbi:uncharacterized protein BO88DRAFT_399728 [Aspergillus vadensis CBS 113365]|uniref:Uncharacterized protein n=1 Tax=Aspergillus vadensis (strain CBS 113365 / IMI 142717 / IBT 24658) TaxID=1448311 RepID=A0A319BQV9_ASPVC|nr:hypothetical protein BO88DRAFT_399728 [Aspergillus vadensis CBS 113365]PYH74049.1 hypothetical protein BO88DRAFT_399728 [Aspergillus vadensis CBS 113365]
MEGATWTFSYTYLLLFIVWTTVGNDGASSQQHLFLTRRRVASVFEGPLLGCVLSL